ncbi:hypothetical protein AAFC00_003998 [Neodothiora populina]|uniref:Transcription factor Iwr1 domain-containing protein n=1 Tax=Neodothiora populina TaxID=2781224 RepID=A0ABR3PIJ3_9PEZI
MTELPSLVRVKRKRGADPTTDLFLEDLSTKRPQTWQFRLQKPHPNETRTDDAGHAPGAAAHNNPPTTQTQTQTQTTEGGNRHEGGPRRFRLAIDKARTTTHTASRKRKAQIDAEDIPTFIEATTAKKQRVHGDEDQSGAPAAQTQEDKPSTALKRPRGSSALPLPPPPPPPPPSQMLVDALSRFALEEAARDEAGQKPKVVSIPKRPVQRYRDRHPQVVAASSAQYATATDGTTETTTGDVDMTMTESGDEDDYVYDTYVRTKDPVMLPAVDANDATNGVQVGYIVITEQDQPFWETYFQDEDTDNEFETDSEDSNAEGYYGADYPEDEVASDDEYNRNAYGYRNAGSDDEQWDSDTGAWSDEEDAMQNPWKKHPWMRGHKNNIGKKDEDDEDEDAED